MGSYGAGEFFRGAIALVLAGIGAAKGDVGQLGKADPSGKRRLRDDHLFYWSRDLRPQAMRMGAKRVARCWRDRGCCALARVRW